MRHKKALNPHPPPKIGGCGKRGKEKGKNKKGGNPSLSTPSILIFLIRERGRKKGEEKGKKEGVRKGELDPFAFLLSADLAKGKRKGRKKGRGERGKEKRSPSPSPMRCATHTFAPMSILAKGKKRREEKKKGRERGG